MPLTRINLSGNLLTRINLSGKLCTQNNCTKLVFSDTTGFFVTACQGDQNNLGYELTGGITLNSVTSAILNVYYPGIAVPIIFNFTVLNGVITNATLTNLNSVITNITSLLTSTIFPLFNFEISKNYGVTLPAINDGLYSWDYTIVGAISSVGSTTPFSYTTSDKALISCKTNCCILKSYVALDLNCGCLEDNISKIIKSEVFMNASKYSAQVGQYVKSEDLLNDAKDICNFNCKDC